MQQQDARILRDIVGILRIERRGHGHGGHPVATWGFWTLSRARQPPPAGAQPFGDGLTDRSSGMSTTTTTRDQELELRLRS